MGPTALPTALSTALPPLLHSTALIRSNRSSYRPYRRSIYINRCLYTFLNVFILAPPHCAHWHYYYWHCGHHTPAEHLLRSPFTVLVISDSPSLMYLFAISLWAVMLSYSDAAYVCFESYL